MAKPNLTYDYFSYGVMGNDATPITKVLDHLPTEKDDPVKVSFKSGFNTITLKYTPDCPLCYYQIRIHDGDTWGIADGTRWYYVRANIAANVEQTVNLSITSEMFPTAHTTPGEYTYVIGLYGKASDSQGLWDVTYLYITTESDGSHRIYAPATYDGMIVYADDPIPNN